MRGWRTWLTVAVLGGVLVHAGIVWALPRVIMDRVMTVTAERAGGANRFLYPPRANAAVREVVRPSPDILYDVCVIDLSNGPIRVSTPVSKPYSSVAVFAANTDNVYVRNDQSAQGERLTLWVARDRQPIRATGAPVARLPSDHGLVLVRRVIADGEHLDRLRKLRRGSRCGPTEHSTANGSDS